MSFKVHMLTLIHNIRFDRIRNDHSHSFKRNLNNYTNSELESEQSKQKDTFLLSDSWLQLYRRQ